MCMYFKLIYTYFTVSCHYYSTNILYLHKINISVKDQINTYSNLISNQYINIIIFLIILIISVII